VRGLHTIIQGGTPKSTPPAGYLLIFCAAAAAVGRCPLLAVLVYVANKHPAFEATAGTLQASVVRLYGIVKVVMGMYPIRVHSR
jgi:hypothetical protein